MEYYITWARIIILNWILFMLHSGHKNHKSLFYPSSISILECYAYKSESSYPNTKWCWVIESNSLLMLIRVSLRIISSQFPDYSVARKMQCTHICHPYMNKLYGNEKKKEKIMLDVGLSNVGNRIMCHKWLSLFRLSIVVLDKCESGNWMNGEEWNRSVRDRIKKTDLCIHEIYFILFVSICIQLYLCFDVKKTLKLHYLVSY